MTSTDVSSQTVSTSVSEPLHKYKSGKHGYADWQIRRYLPAARKGCKSSLLILLRVYERLEVEVDPRVVAVMVDILGSDLTHAPVRPGRGAPEKVFKQTLIDNLIWSTVVGIRYAQKKLKHALPLLRAGRYGDVDESLRRRILDASHLNIWDPAVEFDRLLAHLTPDRLTMEAALECAHEILLGTNAEGTPETLKRRFETRNAIVRNEPELWTDVSITDELARSLGIEWLYTRRPNAITNRDLKSWQIYLSRLAMYPAGARKLEPLHLSFNRRISG